ncbi:MAG TPA: RecX family transcriptional regulator [Bacteroidetes bacterium]|nr:RecX family transcriptional regulator [Bacteroidota bacterium]
MKPFQKDAYIKLMKYCAYQERCHAEVEQKLASLGLYGEEAGEVIVELSREGFLDEERFTRAFVRGKFRFKKWGRRKIANELRQKKISDYCLKRGFEELDEDEYLATLRELGQNYCQNISGTGNIWAKRKKTGSYLLQKGYEPELVNALLKELAEVGF